MSQQINYLRQQGVLSRKQLNHTRVVLIGAGGIGSPLALTLVKMGIPRLEIWDDDIVEPHNLPNQLFRLADIGKPKAVALQSLLNEFAPAKITVVLDKYRKGAIPLNGIVISAVDNMAARKEIWNEVRDNPKVPLYIEARMGLEVLRIQTLAKPTNDDTVNWYESTLYDDEHATEALCTERAIFYTVINSAGWIANQVKRYIRGENLHKEIIVDRYVSVNIRHYLSNGGFIPRLICGLW